MHYFHFRTKRTLLATIWTPLLSVLFFQPIKLITQFRLPFFDEYNTVGLVSEFIQFPRIYFGLIRHRYCVWVRGGAKCSLRSIRFDMQSVIDDIKVGPKGSLIGRRWCGGRRFLSHSTNERSFIAHSECFFSRVIDRKWEYDRLNSHIIITLMNNFFSSKLTQKIVTERLTCLQLQSFSLSPNFTLQFFQLILNYSSNVDVIVSADTQNYSSHINSNCSSSKYRIIS